MNMNINEIINILYKHILFDKYMSSIKKSAADAPPPPQVLPVLIWLEINIRKPLEGTLFDKWIATPAKQYYIGAKRLE